MNKPEERRLLFNLLRMHFPSELFNFNLFWGGGGGGKFISDTYQLFEKKPEYSNT